MSVEVLKRAWALPCVAFVGALGWLSIGNSQEYHRDIPANARLNAGGQGWTCNEGYRQVAGLCAVASDEVPSWGAFEVFTAQGWRCRAGYHRVGSYCVPADAPAHANYVGNGEHWECEWGFRKVAAHCEEIKPPPHGYIDAEGQDWVCYPGFERKEEHCVATAAADSR